MAQYNFGVGQLFLVPPGSDPTPVNVGTLKNVSLDISRDVKKLMGAKAFPEDVALAGGTISGKADYGRIQSGVIAAVLAGSTESTGQNAAANNEKTTIPATPFEVTGAQITAGGTFVDDGGVYDYTNGLWMSRVASSPATGQYSVDTATGIYTFAAADTGNSIGLYYTYTKATGTTIALSNPLMGAATVFKLNVFNTYRSKDVGYTLYAVVFPKLSLAGKQDDYTDTNLEFQAFADSNDQIIDVYTAE